ncbi:MAG: hypothetical protein JST40_11830 [Armatimonadetes bacterium]|nr:hypothetical protein [Armatimonadota bacterium]
MNSKRWILLAVGLILASVHVGGCGQPDAKASGEASKDPATATLDKAKAESDIASQRKEETDNADAPDPEK